MATHYAIIGTGPAGVVAAETIRRLDGDARISLFGREPEPPYSRMAIPYLLAGKIEEAGTYLRKEASHFKDLNIEVIPSQVVSVDHRAKQLRLGKGAPKGLLGRLKQALSGGSAPVTYDKLLVATGSTPFRPDIPGIDLPRVHTCWTLEDARRIAERARPGARVVLMGVGFIGCIIMQGLVKRGVKLQVIANRDRMVPRMMDEKAGGLIRDWCIQQGVTVHTHTQVREILEGDGGALKVVINDGETLEADLMICATGVRPNIGILNGTGIEIDQGIVVDDCMQSSLPDVYAAGDVAQGRDISTGKRSVHAIQPTAVEHARIAASNMVGRPVEHQGSLSMNVLDTLGLLSCSFGLWMGVDGGDSVQIHEPDSFRYQSLQFDGDRLVGGILVGNVQNAGVLRGLIQSKKPLGEWKARLMKNPTQLVEAYAAVVRQSIR